MYVRQRYIYLVELLQYTIPPPPASTINRVRSERIIKQVLKQFVARAYPVSPQLAHQHILGIDIW